MRGEREYPVAPLALPDPARAPDVESVAASAAAELFVQRARESNPSFSLTGRNAAAVAAICWRLGGIPLALELAAAGARFLGPTELLSRLDRALQSSGARDLPERQRTMRSTLDWSHDLLSEAERELFRRLSVFAGGFALEAAEQVAVTDRGDVLELLGRLVEQSLVTAESHESETRYGVIEPIRQYARELLEESGEGEQVRARHAAYYEALAAHARLRLRRTDQALWLEKLAHEHDNLRAALRWLLGRGRPERVVGVGWGICQFWALRGHADEGRRWMKRALAEGGELPVVVRARALYAVAILSFVRGEVERGAVTADESAAMARAAEDPETLATALTLRGLAALSTRDLDVAEKNLVRGLALSRELDDRYCISHGLVGLAQLAMARGDNAEATKLLAEAETISRAEEDWFTLAANLSVQAMAAQLCDDDERAEALLREGVELAATLRDVWTVVLCATGLAAVTARQGRAERAARLFDATEALREKMGVAVSWSSWRDLNERGLKRARERLGREAFDEEWTRGKAMTLEETAAEALA